MRKKLTQLILAAIMIPLGLSAQIWPDDMLIFGNVTENGTPVPSHVVSVSYSANIPGGISGTETTLTDVNGYYQFNITDGSITGQTIVFEVFTPDSCSGVLFEMINNAQGTVDIDTVNFELCGSVGCGVDISYVNDPTLGGNMLTAYPTGVAPFIYNWDSGEITATIFPAEPLNGTYCVTAIDANGCAATSCYTFSGNTPCSASITAQQDPMDSTLYTFTASNLTGVAPFMYEWWPNGGTTQSITTQITPNIDLVCLTVTDANGCIAYVCDTVYPSGCFASFYFGNGPSSEVIAGDPISFYFTGSSEIGNIYEWTVDGSSNYINDPTINYPVMAFPSAGAYEVCVTVDNGGGCSETYCETITVNGNSGNCGVTITSVIDTSGGGISYVLTANPTGTGPFTYDWSNGYPTQSIDYTPGTSPGFDNMVCVWITDANGCVATTCGIYEGNSGSCEGYIAGSVYAGSQNFPLDEGMVYLISFDPITNQLTAIDSTTLVIDSTTSESYYFFGPVPCGDYLVKAAASENSAYYTNHIPTYFGNSPFWDFAETITIDEFNVQILSEITLIAGSNPGGPGFIGGDVTEGANKMGDIGDPVAGVTVMLFDNSSNAIGYTYTDVNGAFGFSDLAWGTYQVYAEMLNKGTTPVVITIGPDQPSFESVHVLVFDTEITTSIDEPEIVLNTTGLYPNPTNGSVSIELASEASINLQISIRDLTGRVVMNEMARLSVGGNKISLDATQLNEGYYNIEFMNVDAGVTLNEKLIVVD
jgi:hypothetical protein